MPENNVSPPNDNKLTNKHYFKIGLTVFLTFAACILFFFIILRFKEFCEIISKIMTAGQSIIIGLVIAYLLNPIMKSLERPLLKFFKKRVKDEIKAKKYARYIAIGGSIFFFIIIIGLLIAAIVPAVYTSIKSLIEILPSSVDKFVDNVHSGKYIKPEHADWLSNMAEGLVDNLEAWSKEVLLPKAQTYITQITSGVITFMKTIFNFIIGIIVAVYVMVIQDTLKGQAKKIIYAIFKPKKANVIIETVKKSSDIFGGFISGKIVDSLIIGLLCYIGCCFLQMPNAILVSTIVGVTNIIPFFGPIIGAIPSVFFVVIQSPIHGLYLLIFIILLQQLDGNVIGPKILGDSTGLSSFWVMFALLVAGGLWGFFGMLLGVPLLAVIFYIIGRASNARLRKKNLPTETEQYIPSVKVDVLTNELIPVVYTNQNKKKNESTVLKLYKKIKEKKNQTQKEDNNK